MGEHEKNKKLEKLEHKKALLLPQTKRAMKLASKIADISERERLEASPQESQFLGTDIFTPDSPAEVINILPPTPWPIEMTAIPESPIIDRFEHSKASKYTRMINDDIDNPDMTDISERTRQALNDAPFSPSFRKTIDAYIAIHKHMAGKGPRYTGETVQD